MESRDLPQLRPCIPREESLIKELSGHSERGLRVSPGRFPGKSYLTNVLTSSNPSEKKELSIKVQKLETEKVHREKIIEQGQRQFFLQQIFDQEYRLRFLQKRKPTYDEPPPPDFAQRKSERTEKKVGKLQENSNEEEDERPRISVRISSLPKLSPNARLIEPKSSNLPMIRKKKKAPVIFAPPLSQPEGEAKSHLLCDEAIVLRITQSLPMGLMIKANQSINAVIGEQKSRMHKECAEKAARSNFGDPRWKNLDNILKSLNSTSTPEPITKLKFNPFFLTE